MGRCLVNCGALVRCTVRDVLYQPDYGGLDYEEGVRKEMVLREGGKEERREGVRPFGQLTVLAILAAL